LSNFRQLPTYETSLGGKQTTRSWFRWFQDQNNGLPKGAEVAVTVGGSPFAFTATSGGYIILRGGTVSAVEVTRTVTTLTGQTAGVFPLSQGDVLTVTYSALPAMVFVPS
jgi:hypothetical protein